MADQMTADASRDPPPPPTPVRPPPVAPAVTPNDREQITDHRRDEDIAALRAEAETLRRIAESHEAALAKATATAEALRETMARERQELRATIDIQAGEIEKEREKTTLLEGWIGESPASYTEGGNVRLMQWNLQDLTTGEPDTPQGQLWEERRLNIVNTILFHTPDVVAIEEVKAGDNGTDAFDEIVDLLRPYGYEGNFSDPVNPDARGKSERVGLIWRHTCDIGLPVNKDAVTFTLLVDVNAPPLRREKTRVGARTQSEKNTVAAAATCLGLDVKKTAKACAKAFCDALPKKSSKKGSGFDRHMVLVTLQTKLGQPLHVLIGHLATKTKKYGTEGNTAEVTFLKELASRAWAAGVWLVVMADTNTDEAGNKGIWDADDDRTLRFKQLGRRALSRRHPTNVYPYQYAIQKEDGKAKPMRNDEIFIPKSWERVSAKTAQVCPAALGAWAPVASRLFKDNETGGKINKQLTYRWSDHLAVIAEVRLRHLRGTSAPNSRGWRSFL